ncbi:hypothetical protein VTJ83DRAFT_1174 [Remersonia thermophila]|uniref:Pentatricopeptide repeat-containing protein n=1 Tax=Remersonia thermophila TaxID=72144 RepID=A0ABR4DNG5_9PEZI
MRDLGLASAGGVCVRCQLRLLVASHARARRGIATSSGAAAVPPGSAAAATAAEEDGRAHESWMQTGPPEPPSSIPTLRPPTDPFSPRRPSSLSIFQSIVESQARTPAAPGAPAAGAAALGLVKDVARIQTMLEHEGATLADAFACFEGSVYAQIKDNGAVPQIIKNQIAAVLLEPLALAKPKDFDSGELPGVARITDIMIELDVLRPFAWAALVIELVQHIYRQKTVPEAYASVKDFETAMARRDVLLHDLVGAWRAFCAQRSSAPHGSSAPKPPAKGAQAGKAVQSNSTFQDAFAAMFPQYLLPSMLKPSLAAFATYKLLTEPFNRTRSIQSEAAPFLAMMKTLIFQGPTARRPPQPADFEAVLDVYPDLPRLLWPPKPAKGQAYLNSASVFRDAPRNAVSTMYHHVNTAVASKNLGAVQRTWAQFWGEAAAPDAERIAQLARHPDMFDLFIYAYTVLRRPQQAIEVWSNMERIGIKPTIKTWSSMLHGCVKASHLAGVHAVWDKLVRSGIQLDTAIWTARIHGLFACGDPDSGLRALEEMAHVWAHRKDARHARIAVQPSIEPVNAALAGLLRLNRRSDVNKLLAWASRRGINPDLYTFNTLLRPLVRAGDMKGIDEVFATMRSINIEADVATFVVLLEGALNQIGCLAPAQQVEVVERILAAMKDAGVEINMRTYAKILHLLLREGGRAEEPVKAVLAHIWHRGLELTSHIYTMLVDHYFSRDPPDCAAVTALIENRRLHENRSIDRVFWERVISGYAQAGDTARALDIFNRVFVAGSTITFSTLYDLLRPLLAEGNMAAAARVVEAARKMGRLEDGETGAATAAAADGGRYWRHRFWHLVYRNGLMGQHLEAKFLLANQESMNQGL